MPATLDIVHLRTLVTIADCGGFGRQRQGPAGRLLAQGPSDATDDDALVCATRPAPSPTPRLRRAVREAADARPQGILNPGTAL
jgi:hypothetical protein